jgi:UDP-galactopyranose mutase
MSASALDAATAQRADASPAPRELAPPLVVYSHLRWASDVQRPQQLMTRMAQSRSIVFVEEPVRGEHEGWQLETPAPGLLVARPITPVDLPGFAAAQAPMLQRMLRRLLHRRGIGSHTAWLCTPMAWPLAQALCPDAVVYDCMDALSAPSEMRERERDLLTAASLVFTGGPSLYRAKCGLHSRVRCVPSSIDAHHFCGAARGTPLDQSRIPRPRLGFCGVIDERVDVDLLGQLAAARSDWHVVLVGPISAPSALPQAANVHYLGPRDYADLPAYVDGWDVCLLPWVVNEATHVVSPTQTLAYMAAELPIVSTPIRDISEPYGEIVYVAEPHDFAAACERALHAPDYERLERLLRMRHVIARTSWEGTANHVLCELAAAEGAHALPAHGAAAPFPSAR